MAQVNQSTQTQPPSTRRFYKLLDFQRAPHIFLHKLSLEYGELVRWRGFFDVYLVNNPDHVRRALTQDHSRFSKRTIDHRVLAGVMGKGLVHPRARPEHAAPAAGTFTTALEIAAPGHCAAHRESCGAKAFLHEAIFTCVVNIDFSAHFRARGAGAERGSAASCSWPVQSCRRCK